MRYIGYLKVYYREGNIYSAYKIAVKVKHQDMASLKAQTWSQNPLPSHDEVFTAADGLSAELLKSAVAFKNLVGWLYIW